MNLTEFSSLNHKHFFPEVLESLSVSLFTSNCNSAPPQFLQWPGLHHWGHSPAVTYGFISFALNLRAKAFSDRKFNLKSQQNEFALIFEREVMVTRRFRLVLVQFFTDFTCVTGDESLK